MSSDPTAKLRLFHLSAPKGATRWGITYGDGASIKANADRGWNTQHEVTEVTDALPDDYDLSKIPSRYLPSLFCGSIANRVIPGGKWPNSEAIEALINREVTVTPNG